MLTFISISIVKCLQYLTYIVNRITPIEIKPNELKFIQSKKKNQRKNNIFLIGHVTFAFQIFHPILSTSNEHFNSLSAIGLISMNIK